MVCFVGFFCNKMFCVTCLPLLPTPVCAMCAILICKRLDKNAWLCKAFISIHLILNVLLCKETWHNICAIKDLMYAGQFSGEVTVQLDYF